MKKTDNLQKIIYQAQIAQKAGNFIEASKLYEECLQKKPDYLPVLNTLGAIYVELGNFNRAEQILKKAITIESKNIFALYNLARLYHIQGLYKKAQQLYEKIVALDPNFGHAWNNLGLIFKELAKLNKAIYALKRASTLLPDYAPVFNNLAVTLEETDNFHEAEKTFKKAIKIQKDYFAAKFNLGCLLFRLERFNEAKYYLKLALKENHTDPTILFLLKCIEQKELPDRAPVEYVKKTFDHCATKFEKTLLKDLNYQTPQKLFELFLPHLKKDTNILDLGCGTGLGAEFYRPYAKFLCGIDCSSKMLKKAREKNIFDNLIEADIIKKWPLTTKFHYIYSSDCLCYFGELEKLFKRIKKELFINGLFGFSVEALKDSNKNFTLGRSGRFAHKKGYILNALKKSKFECIDFKETVLREEKGQPVLGYLVIVKSI